MVVDAAIGGGGVSETYDQRTVFSAGRLSPSVRQELDVLYCQRVLNKFVVAVNNAPHVLTVN